jgi:L-ascorbate metabolism protein UlaG (beta-lactamase superfamily)
MKKLILALALFNLTVLLHAQKSISITYIANDGFLISCESGNILIDALFNTSFGEYDVPSEQLRKEITEGKSPFGKVNLYLVTHMRGDHFYAPYVIDFLKNHAETQFLSSDQVCQDLSREESIKNQLNCISIEVGGQADTTIQKIPIKIYRVKHLHDDSGNIAINLAYLITLDNFKILHIGDAPIDSNISYYDHFHLEKENIDILFQGASISEVTKQFIQEVIRPKYIVAMHIPRKDIETESQQFLSFYSNGLVFMKSLEKKTLTK